MIPVTPVTVREGRANSSALSNQSLKLPGDWNKVQANTNASEFVLPVGTHWVARDVMGISEEVERISGGRCRVASCQCGRCPSEGHFPHVVVERSRGGGTHPVFGFSSFGPHVIQRLREIHVGQNHHAKSMEENQRLRQQLKKRADDVQQEKLEVVAAALASHKHDWRGPDGIRTRA